MAIPAYGTVTNRWSELSVEPIQFIQGRLAQREGTEDVRPGEIPVADHSRWSCGIRNRAYTNWT